MELVKVATVDGNQMVRIPKEYRIDVDKVYVNRVGSVLVVTPENKMEEAFEEGLNGFTEDFMEDGRPPEGIVDHPEWL